MHLVAVVFLSLLNAAEQSRQRIGLQGGATRQKGADASSDLKQYMLPQEGENEGGKCLDGTPAGFYYGPPSSGNSTLWVIFLKGGGKCDSVKDCERWKKGDVDPEITPGGKRGGSAEWKDPMTGGGQLSSDATENPDFHDAHHVYVPYCTGDSHLGQVSNPNNCSASLCNATQVDHWGYYFDGFLNFKAILQELRAQIPAAASIQRVLFQGNSAGGMGVFRLCDFLQDQLGPSVSVKCNPRSCWGPGNIQDGADPDSSPTSYANWSVGSVDPAGKTRPKVHEGYRHPGCVAALGEKEAYKCDTVHNMYQYIKAPVYAFQDMFDYAVLVNLELPKTLHVKPEYREYIAYVGNCTKSSMNQIKYHPQGKQGDGYYLPACYSHGSDTTIGGFSRTDGLGDWFFGRTSEGSAPRVLIDECASMPWAGCGQPACGMLPPMTAPAPNPDVGKECEATLQSFWCDALPTDGCHKCAKDNEEALKSASCTRSLVETLCGPTSLVATKHG